MNWHAVILTFFIALNLSAEACSGPAKIGDKDQPHALVLSDDGQTGSQLDSAAGHDQDMAHEALVALAIKPHRSGMILKLTGLLQVQEAAGVRRHRWLCMERC